MDSSDIKDRMRSLRYYVVKLFLAVSIGENKDTSTPLEKNLDLVARVLALDMGISEDMLKRIELLERKADHNFA